MQINIGDKVRFLNEQGGGKVSRIEGNNMVYILDEDGFEIPSLITEVVLVEKRSAEVSSSAGSTKTVSEPNTFDYSETDNDSEPKVILAALKDENISSNVALYLVNDSNYFAYYQISRANKENHTPLFNGLLEPNTKVTLETLAINYISDKPLSVQLMLFKKDKDYEPIAPIVEKVSFSGGKLMKEASYLKNEYFNKSACITHILKGDFEKKLEALTDKEIKKVIREKDIAPNKSKVKRRDDNAMLEVDLHIHELLDDTRGLSNREMLEIQMKEFHTIMKANEMNKNKKIVFIHGVGNGVLKTELRKSLDRKYKWHSYQDASFANYGYGATMVII